MVNLTTTLRIPLRMSMLVDGVRRQCLLTASMSVKGGGEAKCAVPLRQAEVGGKEAK